MDTLKVSGVFFLLALVVVGLVQWLIEHYWLTAALLTATVIVAAVIAVFWHMAGRVTSAATGKSPTKRLTKPAEIQYGP